MNETWPKESRILKTKDFRRIQLRGKKWKSRDLLFLYLPTKTEKIRVGLVVSKKVGNAVVRNKTKRWLRESFRRQIHSVSFEPNKGVDLVVIAFSSIVKKNYAIVDQQCEYALNKIVERLQ